MANILTRPLKMSIVNENPYGIRRTTHAVPTLITIFASRARPLVGEASMVRLAICVEIVFMLMFALVELAGIEVAAKICKSGAEGGVRLRKSLLCQATNISGAMPRMGSVNVVVLWLDTTVVGSVIEPWQFVASRLKVMRL